MTSDRHSLDSPQPSSSQMKGSQSFLDEASHYLSDPVVGIFTNNKHTQDQVAMGVKAVMKTVPLFMSGPLSYVGLAATGVADEVKTSDTLGESVADGALGLGKAAALGLTRRFALASNASPSLMGVELGIANRASDTALTRANYFDDKGNFSLTRGLGNAALTAFNPISLGADAAFFGAADVVWAKLNFGTRGGAFYNPKLTRAIAGGVFGASTGAGTEIANQIKSGQFNLGDLVYATTVQGGAGLVGGSIGGLQAARQLAIHPGETASEKAAARSTPFQKGEEVDAVQKQLRDGTFIPRRMAKGAMDIDFMFGKVVTADGGEIPAVFRVNDGSDYFQSRMQTEIAMYGLDQKTQSRLGAKLDAGSPVTVARNVEHEGQVYSGFIQEMRGGTLASVIADNALGFNWPRAAARQMTTDNPDFRPSFMAVAAKRMLAGQWDNHARNYLIDPQPTNASRALFGIDLDEIPSPQNKLELQPHPGYRGGFDNIADRLYDQVAGKPLTPELKTDIDAFRKEFGTESGRNDLLSVGFTSGQIDGMLGRAGWFADNGIMPRGVGMPGYNAVSPVLRAIKGLVIPAKPRWQPLIEPAVEPHRPAS